MNIKLQIDQDLKQAMLGGNKALAETLRGLKSAILNAEIAKNKRETGLTDDETVEVLSKEAKKRTESAELYAQGGNAERQKLELDEKEVIDKYLPAQMSESDITALVDEADKHLGGISQQNMGQVIGWVKQKAGAGADGATIARLVKERLQ